MGNAAYKQELIALIKKHLHGRTSAAEEAFLTEYYDYFEREPDVLDSFTEEEKFRLEHELKDSLLQEGAGITGAKVTRLHRGALLRIAATVVLLLGLATIGWMERTDIMNRLDPEKLVEKRTGKGELTQITLSDGSVVWLNVDSRLLYPAEFKRGPRKVKLEGEAYFKVTHNRSRPFLIEAEGLVTRVVGTSFDIKAYPEDSNTLITVLTGVVKVGRRVRKGKDSELQDAVSLTHNQQLTYSRRSKHFHKEADPGAENDIAWKDGRLVFSGTPMAEVVVRLYRWYGIRLMVPKKMKRVTIFADLQNASAEAAVKSIAKILGTDYEKEGRIFILKAKQ